MTSNEDASSIRIVVASPSDYNRVVAEIYLGGKFVALISQEEGVSRLELELPGSNLDERLVERVVSLDLFLSAIAAAKARLASYR
jgi:hypothetical protein